MSEDTEIQRIWEKSCEICKQKGYLARPNWWDVKIFLEAQEELKSKKK